MKSYYFIKIGSWLSRFVPSRLGYWLATLVGSLIYSLSPSVRAAVLSNLSHVLPDAPLGERRKLARRVVRNTLKNYYDLVRLPHLKPEDVHRMIPVREGMEHLEAAAAGGKGVLIVGGHLGNFSLVAQLGAILGYKMGIVAEDIKPAKLYNYVNQLRGRFGLEMIRMGSAQVRTIFKFLRGGGTLMLAADRDVGDAGVPVRFFGEPSDLPAGPVVLAMRLKLPLIPVYTLRRPDNTSTLHIAPPLQLQSTGDYDEDVRVNMQKLVAVLEEMIRRAPDQWVVLQRVWDNSYTSPEGEAMPPPQEQTREDATPALA